jgi:hypothetical protein
MANDRWRNQAIAQPIPRTGGSLAGLLVQWGYFNIHPMIRPSGHVAVSSSGYTDPISLLMGVPYWTRFR